MLDPEERKYYDAWLDSGISISYKNWRGLDNTAKTSMHWATPKTDRMIKNTSSMSSQTISSTNPFRKPERNASQNPFNKSYNPNASKDPENITINQASIKNEVEIDSSPDGRNCNVEIEKNGAAGVKASEDEKEDCGVEYSPTSYNSLGFRIGSPPPEWNKDQEVEKNKENCPETSQLQRVGDNNDNKG